MGTTAQTLATCNFLTFQLLISSINSWRDAGERERSAVCRRPEGSEERKSTKAPTSPQIVIVSSNQALSFSSSHYHSFLLFTINQGYTNKAKPSNSVAPPRIWAPRISPTVVREAAPAMGLPMRTPIPHPAYAMPSLVPTLPCSVPGDSTGTMTVVSAMMIPDSKRNTTQKTMMPARL